ncbi:MAG: carboxypeptidase-like regulatory domain-containing protein, partial [Terracidiphilus sp.]
MLWMARKAVCVWLALMLLVIISMNSRHASAGQTISGVQVDKSSIGGQVLNSRRGKPEAGVWVIAETKSLPVPFRKIVVTDDRGRFLVPALPDGSYELWVRGYGLKDSDRVKAARGGAVTLQVASAMDAHDAAKIYPASYWTSMIQPPPMSELPAEYKSRDEWIAAWRNGCNHCHELGMLPTRRYTTPEQWESVFQRARSMNSEVERLGRIPLEKALSDWGQRIEAGELPPAPPRPTGIERNIVISQWDWGAPESFIHDL